MRRTVLGVSVIVSVLTLLIACGPSGEPDEVATVVESPTEIIEETSAELEAVDDAEGSQSNEAQATGDEITETEQVTEVPLSGFDPENTPDGMVMVFVPEGEFEMGTSDEQKDRLVEKNIWADTWNDSELPVHTVFLDNFWIDRTEVTNAQYALCVADGACQEPHSSASAKRSSYYGNPEFDDFPVTYVDWQMAVDYCAWAGRRLPTEAEWEKAARGTDGRTYPWGEDIDSTLANYDGAGCETCDTATVDSYPEGASPYGALNMAGNVWEWVADEFDTRYYHDSPSENPAGPTITGTRRVVRGGSWDGTANSTRTAVRYGQRVGYANFPAGGIRCAASP